MGDLQDLSDAENHAFLDKAEKAFRELFDLARKKNELHFALALAPEFRGVQDAGWCTAIDAHAAFEDYIKFISDGGKLTNLKARVALGFYCHLAEASGFYEIPKNMLRIASGEPYNLWPFREDLVRKHPLSGETVAPNANKVLRNLADHASALQLCELAEVFRDAFEADLRNGYAHADYVVWSDGIRLPKRNGGHPRKVIWNEFWHHFNRGINFFHTLRVVVSDYQGSYHPPKKIRGRLNDEPEGEWT